MLTELIRNSRQFQSNVCTANIDQDSKIYKWPTFHVPSHYEPTWKKLCSILQFNDKEDLAEAIKGYLKRKKGSYIHHLIKHQHWSCHTNFNLHADPPAITSSTNIKQETDAGEIERIERQVSGLTVDDSSFGMSIALPVTVHNVVS